MNDTFVSIAEPGKYHQQQAKPLRGVSGRALIPAIIAVVLFAGIMYSVATGAGWVAGYDGTVEGFVISLRTDALSPVFRTLSLIGSTKVAVGIMAVFLIFLLVKRQFKAALFFFLAIAIAAAVCLGVKYGVGRPRPTTFLLDAELVETEPCFPSGHSWNAVMIYGMMFAVLNVYTTNVKRFRGVAKLFLVLAIVMPLAIGFSRLYMGEHYPTDVTAGLLGALFFALLFGSWYMRRFTVREAPAPQAAQGWQQVRPIQQARMPQQPAGAVRKQAPAPRQSADATVVIAPGQKPAQQPAATRQPAKKDGGYVGKHAK